MKPRIVFHVVAVIVLAAAVAAAQSPKDKQPTAADQPQATHTHSSSEASASSARETGTGMATGRKSGSVIVLNRDSVTTARETGSGMASGKRISGDPHEYQPAPASAHAAVSAEDDSADPAKMSQAQSNPLYKGDGVKGSNPLYESKDKTAAPSGSGSNKPVEYKDGEDGTTHTRPGNHKPAK